MYKDDFCYVYEKYGWNNFAVVMGKAIIAYFKENNIIIHNHLDLCSGTGELCHLMDMNGISTKGIDSSRGMISISKEKYPNISFSLGNIVDMQENSSYDLITCTCDSINHILEVDDLKKVFVNVFNDLEYNGYFIFDLIDEAMLVENNFVIERDNGIKVYYSITLIDGLKIETNIKVYEHDNFIYEEKIAERIYPVNDVILMLKSIGFEIIKCDNHILNEEQKVRDKKYIIAKKGNN